MILIFAKVRSFFDFPSKERRERFKGTVNDAEEREREEKKGLPVLNFFSEAK